MTLSPNLNDSWWIQWKEYKLMNTIWLIQCNEYNTISLLAGCLLAVWAHSACPGQRMMLTVPAAAPCYPCRWEQWSVHAYTCLSLSPVRIWCMNRLPAPAHHAKCSARLRKYARYGQTSHRGDNPLYTSSGIFFFTPENTKTFKDSIKIDQVRPKTAKTWFAGSST